MWFRRASPLRVSRKKSIELNLLPRETMYRRKSFNALKFAAVLVVILLAVLAVIYINLNNNLAVFKQQEADVTTKINVIKPYYDKSQQFKNYNTTVENKLKSVVTLTAAQPPWPVVMDELGRVMRDSAYLDEMHFDANGYTFKVHGYVMGTPELQKLLVNFYHSEIFNNVKAEQNNKQKKKASGTIGGNPSGGGGNSGGRYSEPAPSPTGGDSAQAPGDQGTDMGMGRPEPMYKLPSGGSTTNTIEWYFQGHEFELPAFYEFTISGTLNTAVMQSGKDMFGDLKDLVSAAQAATKGGGPTPTTPGGAAPGATPPGGAPPGGAPPGGGSAGGGNTGGGG